MQSVQVVYNGGMAKRVEVQTDLTAEELQKRYRQTTDAVERTPWHLLWQAQHAQTPPHIPPLPPHTATCSPTPIRRLRRQRPPDAGALTNAALAEQLCCGGSGHQTDRQSKRR